MDKVIIRVFLEILGVFSLLGAYSYSSCSPPSLCLYLGLVSKAELPFKDAIENQGRGKNLQRLVVGVWREGGFLTGFNGAGSWVI